MTTENNDKAGRFDGLLTDSTEASSDEAYVVPNYIETKLSKEKRQECRSIVKTVNQFGVSQRQKLYLIYLLALELENRDSMMQLVTAITKCKDSVEDNKIITTSDSAAPKKLIVGG